MKALHGTHLMPDTWPAADRLEARIAEVNALVEHQREQIAEMLEALEAFCQEPYSEQDGAIVCTWCLMRTAIGEGHFHKADCILDKALAAIQKAKGQQAPPLFKLGRCIAHCEEGCKICRAIQKARGQQMNTNGGQR